MVAVALIGVVALVTGQLYLQFQRVNDNFSTDAQLANLRARIEWFFADKDNCDYNMRLQLATRSINQILNIDDSVFLEAGTVTGFSSSVDITSISTTEIDSTRVQLTVAGDTTRAGQIQSFTLPVILNVIIDSGTSKIVTCHGSDWDASYNSMDKLCQGPATIFKNQATESVFDDICAHIGYSSQSCTPDFVSGYYLDGTNASSNVYLYRPNCGTSNVITAKTCPSGEVLRAVDSSGGLVCSLLSYKEILSFFNNSYDDSTGDSDVDITQNGSLINLAFSGSAATNTPTPTPTDTATNTPTATATNTPTPTPTDTPTDTPTPTNTPTPTDTPTPTPTPTNTATNTPTPSCTQDNVGIGGHRLFVSNVIRTPNLGSASAYDTVCQSAASSASLTMTYYAIMATDENTGAKDRLASLINTDGDFKIYSASLGGTYDVATSWTDFWDSTSIGHAIQYSELGADLSGDSTTTVWTGSGDMGAAASPDSSTTCNAWTTNSSGSSAKVGTQSASNGQWINSSSTSCDKTSHIYCVSDERACMTSTPTPTSTATNTPTGTPTPTPTTCSSQDGVDNGRHRLFVTSASIAANSNFDMICSVSATSAGLTMTYYAIYSTAAGTGAKAKLEAQLDTSGSFYILNATGPTQYLVASNWADMWDGSIGFPFRFDQTGAVIASVFQVWTASSELGVTDTTNNCTYWSTTSSGVSGKIGNPTQTTSAWINSSTVACNNMSRVMCVSQKPACTP